MENIIGAFTLEKAIADGALVPLGWADDLPVIATAAIMADLAEDERQRLFVEFFGWERDVEPTLPEEDRLFAAKAGNGQTVWVINDGAAITLLYPSDY